MGAQVTIVEYQPGSATEVVKMWRRSFRRAMGLPKEEASDVSLDAIRAQVEYFARIDPADINIAVLPGGSPIVGMLALVGSELEHLYVHVNHQGVGIGSKLLNLAKERSPQGLQLYTFQKNSGARAFYRSHGFVETAKGYAALADNPWATSQEQLADVRMVWRS